MAKGSLTNEYLVSNSEIERLNSKVDKIYDVLVGDDALGTKGVIPRLQRVEERQGGFDRKLTYAGGFMAGIVVVWEIFRRKLGF